MSEFSVDHKATICHDQDGWSVAVQDDRDGLDLCEIVYEEGVDRSRISKAILLPWEAARLLAVEILTACDRAEASGR